MKYFLGREIVISPIFTCFTIDEIAEMEAKADIYVIEKTGLSRDEYFIITKIVTLHVSTGKDIDCIKAANVRFGKVFKWMYTKMGNTKNV